MTGRKSEGGVGVGGEGVCGGSRSRGRTHPPDTHTLSPPTGAQRPLPLFLLGAHRPRQLPHPPRLSHHHRRPDPTGTPPPPAPLTKPSSRCFPGPPAGCRGYNGAAEKRDLTFHWGRGGETPLPRPLDPLPSPCSPPFGEEEGSGAADGDFPAGGGEPSPPLLACLLRPLPKCLLGMPGINGASGKLGRDGCGRRPPGLPLPTAPKQ